MHRLVVSLALALTLIGAAATPALAEGFIITGACKFPVEIEITADKQRVRTFTTKTGTRTIITGTLRALVTNDVTGESRELNISGPVFVTPHEDGTSTMVLRGNSLIITQKGDPLGGQLLLASGPVVLEVNAAGTFTEMAHQGQEEDLCAALAP